MAVVACPSCGASVDFKSAASILAVCEYCRSTLVRQDINVENIGKMAGLKLDGSPLQLAAQGRYRGVNFGVIGRIQLRFDQGIWNEWHLMMNDGTSGWLSDAQGDYAVTFNASGRKLPDQCKIGQQYTWDKEAYTVSTITKAHYRGGEGELPFQYWDKTDVVFVDLMSYTGKFATIDYSDDDSVLYLGAAVAFESLKLKKLRSFEGWS